MGYASVGSGLQNSVQSIFNPYIYYFSTGVSATTEFYSQIMDVTNKTKLAYSLNHEATGAANSVFNIKFGTTLLATNTENSSDSDISGLIDISAYSGSQTIKMECVNAATTGLITNLSLWLVD